LTNAEDGRTVAAEEVDMVRIASFNVENFFARPRALKLPMSQPNPYLAAYGEVNDLMAHPIYTPADKAQMTQDLLTLEIYVRNAQHAIRKNPTRDPQWAWLRMNRGKFDRQPTDESQDVEIIAAGRSDWIGWVELALETADEVGTRMTGQVVKDIDADIQAFVEVEDRPTLVRFNEEILGGLFAAKLAHVRLLDGNDDRGIDVGLMTKTGFEIQAIRTNVDIPDPGAAGALLFSRDCADYEIAVPGGATIRLLVNHFKSQSGGGGPKRLRQSTKVREIVDALVAAGQDVIVLGDFNEGQPAVGQPPTNLPKLFEAGGPLTSVWDLPAFSDGGRPGTFDTCSIRNRLDYILLSPGLVPKVTAGGVWRKGLWGDRQTRPTAWQTYPEMTAGHEQASDHAAIYVDLTL
jgi:endonuclease/exonuclease/phosphatase family metal-dependent hydrolase